MNELIKKILELIKDYRREDISFFYRQKIDESHINKWIESVRL